MLALRNRPSFKDKNISIHGIIFSIHIWLFAFNKCFRAKYFGLLWNCVVIRKKAQNAMKYRMKMSWIELNLLVMLLKEIKLKFFPSPINLDIKDCPCHFEYSNYVKPCAAICSKKINKNQSENCWWSCFWRYSI